MTVTPVSYPTAMTLDVTAKLGPKEIADASLSETARHSIGSEILKIAAEIRALKAEGATICNLTVGDFDPAYFPLPPVLLEGVKAALDAGHTNYPPSDGVLPLREAVVEHYERELGLKYPVESVLVQGGARPLLYGAYKTILDPGDVAVYPVPSWNNNHYAHLVGARGVPIAVGADTNFFPTPEQIRPHLHEARLLLINSPLNPTGTVIAPEALRALAEMVVDENQRRRRAGGKKGLWLVYDQVYWQLTFGDAVHATPVALVPEVAPWTLLLDAASKSFAATGLRVGWGVMPPAIRQRMADIMGHVGAWAPKAEQIAVAALLRDPAAMRRHHASMGAQVRERLDLLSNGFRKLARAGLPVETFAPQGAIYLSVRIALPGKTNEETRRLLLERAGLAVVPFQAFNLREESGWFRMSVGAVSTAEIAAVFPRLREVLH